MNTEQFDGHTPGPWRLSDGTIWGGEEENFVSLALNVEGCYRPKDPVLMAAAPDLLAELKRWQPIIQGCDLALLKRQKDTLFEMIWKDSGSELMGLVNLLDALQDLLEGEEVIA